MSRFCKSSWVHPMIGFSEILKQRMQWRGKERCRQALGLRRVKVSRRASVELHWAPLHNHFSSSFRYVQTLLSGLFEAGFIPVEVQAGDLVCFPGELDHLSLPNYSDLQRHTFQLHLGIRNRQSQFARHRSHLTLFAVDGPRAGVEWSKENWLQYPQRAHFPQVQFKSSQSAFEKGLEQGTRTAKANM